MRTLGTLRYTVCRYRHVASYLGKYTTNARPWSIKHGSDSLNMGVLCSSVELTNM